MNIRKFGFHLISKLKSSPVNDFINEFYLDRDEKEELISKRLNNIVATANKETVFYSKYNSFDQFPIVTKAVLRERYKDFLSRNLDSRNAIIATTSGSTGQPMTYYLSKTKKYRQNAEVIFYNRWANIDVGDAHAYIRVNYKKSSFALLMHNQVLMNPEHLTDEWISEQIKIIMNKQLKGIIGYPSVIAAIAHFARENGYSKKLFCIKGIVTTGETLTEPDAKITEEVFGVYPISRYSAAEFGVIATCCPRCGRFHCNDTGYIVEVLKLDEDKPAEVGEPGRVVVTDLFSDYMPLIRFDTGDLAVYGGKSECSFYPTGIVLEEILGRQIETVYDINGEPISGFAINSALKDFNTIKQFQFIQNALDSNTLLLTIKNDFNDKDKAMIEDRIAKLMGTEPEIKIVNEIPVLKSGKRPYIVSYYKKNESLSSKPVDC